MGQRHGLGALQVRVPREVGVARLLGSSQQHLLQGQHPLGHLEQGPLRVEPEVGGDLVVAAPSRVQLGARRAGQLRDATLHRRVDVLVGRHEGERPVGQLDIDLVQGGEHVVALRLGEHTRPHQSPDVGARALDVVGGEALVEREADGEGEELVRGTALEATVPQGHECKWPWVPAQVSTDRPHRRTNPAESS